MDRAELYDQVRTALEARDVARIADLEQLPTDSPTARRLRERCDRAIARAA